MSVDPDHDFEAIAYRLACLDFAWDIERALEFALFRTYAAPRISGLLARTGAFERATRKRYDDTELLLSEAMENGLDSARGVEAVTRINAIHSRFKIANDDMLYVLSTFVLEPIRWMDRYGRRPFSPDEIIGWTQYYRALGEKMGITGIPEDRGGFERLSQTYEAAHITYAQSNHAIGTVTLNLLLGFYLPRFRFWIGRPVALSLMDPPLLRAMGFAAPPAIVRGMTHGALRLRARGLRLLPLRKMPRHVTQRARPSYPGGYIISELGNGPASPRADAPRSG